VGARFSSPVQTSFGAHMFSSTMGTWLCPGVKWPGRGIDHLALSSAEIKKGVELSLYSPCVPSWQVIRNFTSGLLCTILILWFATLKSIFMNISFRKYA